MFVSPADRAGRKRVLGLQFWIEGRSIDPPNVTTPVVSWTINDTAGVVDAAVVPKGATGGSFMLAVPDNLPLGGNKRGLWAVDMQLRRTTNTMVAAADYSALIAGRNNTIVPSTSPLYAGIFVGLSNQITGIGSASATGSVVLGGQFNVITDNGGVNGAGILGGSSNAITVATGKDGQAIVGSFSSAVSGNNGVALGGREHNVLGDHTVAIGYQSKTRGCVGSLAHGCNTGSAGDGQFGRFVMWTQTNDAVTVTPLTQNGGAGTAVNQAGPIPSGFVFAFTGLVVANTALGTAGGSWRVEGAIRNAAGTLVLVTNTGGGVVNTTLDAALAGCTVAIALDNVFKCIRINVTGVAGTNVQWCGWLETCEKH